AKCAMAASPPMAAAPGPRASARARLGVRVAKKVRIVVGAFMTSSLPLCRAFRMPDCLRVISGTYARPRCQRRLQAVTLELLEEALAGEAEGFGGMGAVVGEALQGFGDFAAFQGLDLVLQAARDMRGLVGGLFEGEVFGL